MKNSVQSIQVRRKVVKTTEGYVKIHFTGKVSFTENITGATIFASIMEANQAAKHFGGKLESILVTIQED